MYPFEIEAIVEEEMRPGSWAGSRGRVRYQGSSYPAWCEQRIVIAEGEVVHVIARSGITLIVEPVARTHFVSA